MLDVETLLFVRDVLGQMPDGHVFSLPDLKIPGYDNEMTDPERRGMGKRLDDTVRRNILDCERYRIEIVVDPRHRKPQLYRKVVVNRIEGLLLKDADIYQTLRHLGGLLGWGNVIEPTAVA